ncbi:hypothetical protein QAD02_014661 [Eretmocerus hayati]|uniref:Uncharacterized protein n=1 Tax=Eretmocerus hayati TaxID=131215 RepID=A0ACC2P8E8_9HYME|nr:hypothetical protein QAD02_014661 [Eretmocerus hayati]
MTRILGFFLGLSLQTELLIMTLLGLANSTLNWKPFDLGLKLDKIRNFNFLHNNIQFSHTFTTWTKTILRSTVVLEFFCSLVLPFVYLLKLYPIITWSRSYILLPWLVTHALNTILPKILSVALAFVFHREGIVSTMSFLEFLLVESINLTIAVYNWYVFFTFYENLRRLERKRKLQKIYLETLASTSCLRPTYSSIPNIHQKLLESSADDLDGKKLHATRSLTLKISVLGNNSLDLESKETSPTSESIENSDLLKEKTVSSQNVKLRRSGDARTFGDRTSQPPSSLEGTVANEVVYQSSIEQRRIKNSDTTTQSARTVDNGCVCPSSEEDDEVKLMVSERIRTKPPTTNEELDTYILQSVLEIESRKKARALSKKTSTQNMQSTETFSQLPLPHTLLFLPKAAITLNERGGKFSDCSPFSKRDLKLFSSIYESTDYKNHTTSPRDQKWLIFHSELESNLKGDVLLKELSPDSSMRERDMKEISRMKRFRDKAEDEFDFWRSKDPLKTGFSGSKWNRVQNMIDQSMGQMNRAILLQSSGNEMRMWNVQKKTSGSSKSDFSVSEIDEISKMTISSETEKESSRSSAPTTENYIPYSRAPKYQKSNISVLKSIKPVKWSQYIESQKEKELRNLQRHNDLHHELDERDEPQKKKRSKLTTDKNVANELSLFNSDVTMSKKESRPANDRSCRSSGVQKALVDRSHQHQYPTVNQSVNNKLSVQVEVAKSSVIKQPRTTVNDDRGLDHLFEKELTNYDNTARLETPVTKPNQRDAQIPGSMRRASLREAIEQLNWSCHETPVETTSLIVTNFADKGRMSDDEPTRESRSLVDDETMSLLQSAFSHSDESDHGFRLGVESGEPYPVFQTVTLTVAEIFKAVNLGHEPATDQLSAGDDVNGIELQLDDSIVCGCNHPTSQETMVDFTTDEEFEEDIEKRKNASAELLDQLQQLLDSSRRTLSALDIVRGEVKIAEAQLFAGTTTDCIDAFKELYERGEKMKSVASRVDDKNTSGDSSKIASTLEGARVDFSLAGRSNDDRHQLTNNGVEIKSDRGSGRREKAGGSGAGRRKSKAKVFETIFENKMQMHQIRRGEGLSSGNVMEFDSEGQVLSCMESQNPSFVVQPTSDTFKKERNRSEEALRGPRVLTAQIKANPENRRDFGGANDLLKKLCPCQEHSPNLDQDLDGRLINDLKLDASNRKLLEQSSRTDHEAGELAVDCERKENPCKDLKSTIKIDLEDEAQLFSKLEVELNSSDLSNTGTGMKYQNTFEYSYGKQDQHTNGREVASSTEINIPTIMSLSPSENKKNRLQNHQQLLADHHRTLESDSIKNTIKSWAEDSMESLFSIDHRDYNNPTPPQQISFSNSSELEEFQ